jgi:hypothetical protein
LRRCPRAARTGGSVVRDPRSVNGGAVSSSNLATGTRADPPRSSGVILAPSEIRKYQLEHIARLRGAGLGKKDTAVETLVCPARYVHYTATMNPR